MISMSDCKKTWRMKNSYGYPLISIKGKQKIYSRHLYEKEHNIVLTSDEEIMHTCDNVWCVEITHLVRGSHRDNMADMVSKERHAKGERNGHAKLTWEDVDYIRESNKRQKDLAKQFNVDPSLISRIISGEYWK